jgi:hypothetical protein
LDAKRTADAKLLIDHGNLERDMVTASGIERQYRTF